MKNTTEAYTNTAASPVPMCSVEAGFLCVWDPAVQQQNGQVKLVGSLKASEPQEENVSSL